MEIDVTNEENFDYFNTDVYLLTLHILLEGFYRGQGVFTLDQFLKGNYWKIEEISDEIRDTNDFGSVEDMVLHQVFAIIEGLNLGKIRRLSIKDISGLLELVIRKAIETTYPAEDDVMYYSAVINEIYDLKKLSEAKIEEVIKKQQKGADFRSMINGLNFDTANEALKHLNYISSIAAPYIEMEISFIDEVAKEIDKGIDDYLLSFSQDDFVDQKPVYRQKRYYFSKQLENFYNYIKGLPVIDGSINIPFSALAEQGFEVIKILSYLEREKRVKVRNWNDVDMWNVKFHTTPITLASLLDKKEGADEGAKDKELKLNLSFSHQTGIMLIRDQNGKESKIKVQGQVQKEVLRVIFQNPKNTYSEWSLYEISDILGQDDVNEVAVKNAIYQFNRKVKLEIPEVKNLFELTKHSAQLNPKYVSKN